MARAEPEITLRRMAPDVLETDRDGVSFKREPTLGIAKLRIREHAAEARFQELTGTSPPTAGRQIAHEFLIYAWMAPGEWLVTGPEDDVASWLAQATAGGHDDVLAVDFSHARTAFRLSGVNARQGLAAHCPLDLWPKNFPVGAVARSLLGDAAMFIARLADMDDAPQFRIIVDQTMAAYAGRLFARA